MSNAAGVRIRRDSVDLAQYTAHWIAEIARECVRERGRFLLALSGGSTPKTVYERLAASPLRESFPWEHAHLFFGDERCVPPDHPDSNYRMALEAMIARVPIPPGNVHRVEGADRDPAGASRAYENTLRKIWGEGGVPVLDLVLLGLGADGHTASLFPGTEALSEQTALVTVGHKGDQARITFTLPLINASRQVVFLVSGPSKAEIVRLILERADETPEIPATLVRPAGGVQWFLDRDASKVLTKKT